MLVVIEFFSAISIVFDMSLKCWSGVLFNWCFKWFKEPLVKRFCTLHPESNSHCIDFPSSINVKTSILFILPLLSAQLDISLTELSSPSDTLAEATSILSILRSSNKSFAIVSFSLGEYDTPEVCSPSLRVVSIISICLGISMENYWQI